MSKIINVVLGQVAVWALNPRKRVDPAGIEEMAESILVAGILQYPVARVVAGTERLAPDAVRYEIIYGQRRFLGQCRALELARERGLPPMEWGLTRAMELEEIRLVVREMSDSQALEGAWIENLQREEVRLRDEVEGYQALLGMRDGEGKPVYSVRSLAERLGKSAAYVSWRLKLREAPECLWEAYEAGSLPMRVMRLAVQVPTRQSRMAFAKAVIKPVYKDAALSYEEALDLMRSDFSVSLRRAPWDLDDGTLLPVVMEKGVRICGGDCTECPQRTGNQEELDAKAGRLAGDLGWDAYSCLMPSCYRDKQAAIFERLKGYAAEQGQAVMPDREAARVFHSTGEQLAHDSAYVRLDESPDFRATGHHGDDDLPAWEELLAGTDYAPKVVVAQHPKTGAVARLMLREDAIALVEARYAAEGKASLFANRPKPASRKVAPEGAQSTDGNAVAGWSRWEKDGMVRDGIRMRVLRAVADGVALKRLWEHLAQLSLELVDGDGELDVVRQLLLLPEDATKEDARETLEVRMEGGAVSTMRWAGAMLLLAMWDLCGGSWRESPVWRMLEASEVDLEALEAEVRAEVEEKEAVVIRERQKVEAAKRGCLANLKTD